MRIDQRGGGKPPVIRYAPDADAAVILRNILNEPVDRVVRVGALIDGLSCAFVPRRAVHKEFPFGIVAAANILEYKNIIILNELRIAVCAPRIGPFDTIGSPLKQDR